LLKIANIWIIGFKGSSEERQGIHTNKEFYERLKFWRPKFYKFWSNLNVNYLLIIICSRDHKIDEELLSEDEEEAIKGLFKVLQKVHELEDSN
jgi:hypothetical protein